VDHGHGRRKGGRGVLTPLDFEIFLWTFSRKMFSTFWSRWNWHRRKTIAHPGKNPSNVHWPW